MAAYYPGSNFNDYHEDVQVGYAGGSPNHYSGNSPNHYMCDGSNVYGTELGHGRGARAELLASSYSHSGIQDLGNRYSLTPQSSTIPPAYDDPYPQSYPYASHAYDPVLPQLSPTPPLDNYGGSWQAGGYVSTPTAGQSQPYQKHAHQHVHPASTPALSSQEREFPWHYPTTQSLHIPPTTHRNCEWEGGSCGVALDDISPAGIARHLRTHHFRNNWQARSRGRCSWGTGCRGDEMNFESMGKHVAQVHLGSTKRQCHQCGGTFARNDALLRHLREHCES